MFVASRCLKCCDPVHSVALRLTPIGHLAVMHPVYLALVSWISRRTDMQNQILAKQHDAFAGPSEGERTPTSESTELKLVQTPLPLKLRACVGRKMARRGITLDSGIFKPFSSYWS